MSSLTVDNIVLSDGATVPIFTAAERPIPEEGLTIWNSTEGVLQIASSDGAWVSIGSPAGSNVDGLTPASAFSTLDQVATLYTGTKTLYTTAGGGAPAFQVLVNFDVTGGPWYVMSFVMPSGYRWDTDGVNGTVAAGVYSDGNSTNSSTTRPARTGTVPNMGSRRIGEIYTTSYISSVSNSTGRGWYAGGAGYNTGWLGIEYFNHATAANFTPSQAQALRNSVTELSNYTPHCGLEVDAQGLGSQTNWRQDYTGNIGGHGNWLRSGNQYMRSTPSENASDERGAAWFWTHNSYQAELYGGGSFDYAVGGGTPSGLPAGFIMPDAVKLSGTTGGGSMFGTPYMSFAGFENRLNNRNYFLCK